MLYTGPRSGEEDENDSRADWEGTEGGGSANPEGTTSALHHRLPQGETFLDHTNKKPAYLQALLYSWQSMYIDAQICAYAQVPPKPEPKTCTRPVPFQLVSVMRHEEEQQRMAAERAQAEQLEALLKEFRAQPNLSKWVSPSPNFPYFHFITSTLQFWVLRFLS